jgi:hypothetical protein
MWDKTKAIPALESYDPDVLFVCGSCRNRDEFRPYFTKVLTTTPCADDWLNAPTTSLAKNQKRFELMLKLNREDDRPADSIDVDAARPINEVVDDILAHCRIRPQL